MNNVRNYTTEQLLNHAKKMEGFKGFPTTYWTLFVASNEDANDRFDDKVYLFRGEKFVMVTSCTVNKGNKGTGVVCHNVWNYGAFGYGLHQGKTPAGRQRVGFPYRRDFTNDGVTNPTSEVKKDIRGFNFHAASHDLKSKAIKTNIGGWSEGCMVLNNIPKYVEMLALLKPQKVWSMIIVTEFEPTN